MTTRKKKFYDIMSWSIQTKAIITSIALVFGSITSIISFNEQLSKNYIKPYIQKQTKSLIDSLEKKVIILERNQRLQVIMADDSTTRYQKQKMLNKIKKNLNME